MACLLFFLLFFLAVTISNNYVIKAQIASVHKMTLACNQMKGSLLLRAVSKSLKLNISLPCKPTDVYAHVGVVLPNRLPKPKQVSECAEPMSD